MDRNLRIFALTCILLLSLSARRAWIEIAPTNWAELLDGVALRKESVDRNLRIFALTCILLVALRKESVDRNNSCRVFLLTTLLVALRKESVDRNIRWC